MPLSEFDKRDILLGNGLNPDDYDLDESGYALPKVKTAPALSPPVSNTPLTPQTTKFVQPSDTPFQTGLKTFAEEAPSALGGGVGMAAGLQASIPFYAGSPWVGIPASIILGTAGALGGSYLTKELQQEIEPEEWQKNVAASRELNPTAGMVGQLSTIPLSGFRPSIKNVGLAASALPRLSGINKLTKLERATPQQLQALANVGTGAALGGVQPVAESLLKTGELPDAKDVALNVAIGGLVNEPWKLGRMLGFHPTVTPKELPSIEDTLPLTTIPKTDVREQPIKDQTISGEEQPLLNKITGATWVVDKKGVARPVPLATHLSELPPAESSARAIQELSGTQPEVNPQTRRRTIEISEAEKRQQDFEEAQLVNEQLRQAKLAQETAAVKEENARLADELKSGLTTKFSSNIPEPRVTTETGKEIRPDYTGVTEIENLENASKTDLEARRFEGLKDKYSPASELKEEAPIGTTFTGEVVGKIKGEGIAPTITDEFFDLFKKFTGLKRGTKLESDGSITHSITGKPVAGVSFRDKMGQFVSKINPEKAGLDTPAHESAHPFFTYLRENGSPAEKKLVNDFESLVQNSEEFKSINEARNKAGEEVWTPEEYIATEQGYEFLDRNLKLKGETEFKTIWKDLWTDIKVKFGKDATNEDYRRLLQYKFQYDKPVEGSPVKVQGTPTYSSSSELADAAKTYDYTYDGEQELAPGYKLHAFTARNKDTKHVGATFYLKPEEATPENVKTRAKKQAEDFGAKYSESSELNEPFYYTAHKMLKGIGAANAEQWKGTIKNKLNPLEQDLLKQAGIDEFLSGGKRSGKEVSDWIRANAPKIEVHSYGMEGKVSEAKREYDKMTHEWYETLTERQKSRLRSYKNYGMPDYLNEPETGVIDRAKADKYLELQKQVANEPRDTSPRATSYYNIVSALPTDEPMPEWTKSKMGKNVQRVDVVIPQGEKHGFGVRDKNGQEYGQYPNHEEAQATKERLEEEYPHLKPFQTTIKKLDENFFTRWKQDNLHENLPNTLGWAMIQYKTGPKGEKIALLAEHQDYHIRSNHDGTYSLRDENYSKKYNSWNEADKVLTAKYPILKDRKRLVLKAAIDQAQKEGATHIVVSDAETAMMTEGHDAANTLTKKYATKEEALKAADELLERGGLLDYLSSNKNRSSGEVSVNNDNEVVIHSPLIKDEVQQLRKLGYSLNQEPGMRLNYDTILPKIAEELTGSKGERVSLGEHKNAYDTPIRMLETGYQTREAALRAAEYNGADASQIEQLENGNWGIKGKARRSNLIFRNPDGTPKTDVSGYMYPIDKTPENFSLTAKKYSEKSQLKDNTSETEIDPAVKKVTQLAENAFDDSQQALHEYDNIHAALAEEDVSNKLYRLRGILSGSPLDVKNSESSQLRDDNFWYDYRKKTNKTATGKYAQEYNLPEGVTYGDLNAMTQTGKSLDSIYQQLIKLNPELSTIDVNQPNYKGSFTPVYDVVAGVGSKFRLKDIKHFVEEIKGSASGKDVKITDNHIVKDYSESSQLKESYKSSFVPFITARYDKIKENIKSPTASMVTQNLHNFEFEKDLQTGRLGNALIEAGKDFSDKEQARVYRYAHQMSIDGESPIVLTGREQKLFNARLKILRDFRKQQNDIGMKVFDAGNFRKGGFNPAGYMFSMIDPEVPYTWSTHMNSAKSKGYDAAYIDHLTKHGFSEQEAKETLALYKAALGSNQPTDIEFGALRKAAGVGLPWELVDKNFNSAAMRYGRRAGRDYAYFKWIQSDPKMLKALNEKDQFGKLPDPASMPEIDNISDAPEVKQAKRSVFGESDAVLNPTTMAWARAANNTIMGVGTAARNILNMPAFVGTYVQLKQLPLIAKAVSNMNEARVRAFKNNAVRASFADYDAAGFYLGNPNPTIRLLNRYSELARKYQGRDFSDRFEGEFYYSLGEQLATDNIARAKNGEAESKRFLKQFGSTVDGGWESLLKRKVTEDDISRLAKSVVDHARGTYGASGLPSFAIEGQLSPFFALNRFNIEKANTVWKDVILPMREGIYGPAIRYVLGSAGMGLAIEQLNELLSNKRGSEPTLSEVITSGTESDLVAKAISTMQLASFAGSVSDIAQIMSNSARGKGLAYNNPVSFPLYTLVTDTWIRNISDAANAIKEGEEPFEVLGKLATTLSTQSVQTMRYIDANYLNPEEAKRKEKFRDYSIWQELTNRKDPEAASKANAFKNLSSKEFKRETDVSKAADMLPALIDKAIEKSKDNSGNIDPVKLDKELLSLKLNSYQVMPALETDPAAFVEYYEHLKRTQGEKKADALIDDFMMQREVNKAKAKMVPKL